ncbi:MAG: DEAD/DEAH box helicase [Anaerolineales bacterium]|nr:DEAD/DEAH box helicase [Anaerolineales bacterium]
MALESVLRSLRADPHLAPNITVWERIPPRETDLVPLPEGLRPEILSGLRRGGIERLYAHQAAALEAAGRGEHVVLATGTASGKTLAYNLPILQRRLSEPDSTAMYLFPTKALARDQAAELARWEEVLAAGGMGIRLYDGDTPQSRRGEYRRSARFLVTNPDMLHLAILPHHTRWAEFLSRLRYVVLDEVHVYRGVFGSHMANVLRRLGRICSFYQPAGPGPQFFMTSATIANPRELAERLIDSPATLIDRDGSPRAERHLILYNPPLADPALGLRRSYLRETQELALRLLQAGVQTAVFARTRRSVELLLGALRDRASAAGLDPKSIRGYRAGYLSEERREIEAGLRAGTVRCVVATSALELGVDIGSLGAAVIAGYPGTVASFWQRAGRAGRRDSESLAVLVAASDPLDQFLIGHPEFLLGRSPEHARINPDNLAILAGHLRCSAFEMPFASGERFGAADAGPILEAMAEEGELHRAANGEVSWVGEAYPAAEISLRTAGADRVMVQEIRDGHPRLIGEVDRAAAPAWVHAGAIYLHEGRTYFIESLDWRAGTAAARPIEADYYTETSQDVELEVLAVRDASEGGVLRRAWGEVHITARTAAFRKVRRATGETVGHGEIDLPPNEFQTAGCWLWAAPDALAAFEGEAREFLALIGPNNYGPSWTEARRAARARDEFRCARCGAPESLRREHDVHHLVPFRSFGYVPGQNENHKLANAVENLVTLCPACHQRVEAQQGTHTALGGLAHALHNLAPLILMCDSRDIGCSAELRGKETGAPTVTFFDNAAEGLGLSEELYDALPRLLASAADLIRDCPCAAGCPACVGPVAPGAGPVKAAAQRLAEILAGGKAG